MTRPWLLAASMICVILGTLALLSMLHLTGHSLDSRIEALRAENAAASLKGAELRREYYLLDSYGQRQLETWEWSRWARERGTCHPSLLAMIYDAADASKFDRGMTLRLVMAESTCDPLKTSPRGAVGLIQVMPSTAESIVEGSSLHLQDPAINLSIGLTYLGRLVLEYGNLRAALAHYNTGYGGFGMDFAEKVMGR